jgi:hypothetical protein
MSLGQTIRNILGIVISPKFNALDKLNQLRLRPLTFELILIKTNK